MRRLLSLVASEVLKVIAQTFIGAELPPAPSQISKSKTVSFNLSPGLQIFTRSVLSLLFFCVKCVFL